MFKPNTSVDGPNQPLAVLGNAAPQLPEPAVRPLRGTKASAPTTSRAASPRRGILLARSPGSPGDALQVSKSQLTYWL